MKNYSEERVLNILWDIYYKTTDGKILISYQDFCKEHKITNALFPVLVKHKALEATKVKTGKKGKCPYSYKWNTIKPNIYMTQKLIEELLKINKESGIKYRLKTKELKSELNDSCETKQKLNKEKITTTNQKVFNHFTQTFVDPSDPFNGQQLRPIDFTPTKEEKEENVLVKQQSTRKISILWGLIYIQW